MLRIGNLNRAAFAVLERSAQQAAHLRIDVVECGCGAQVLDFGVQVPGGIHAGVQMARICLADQATVNVTSGDRQIWPGPWVQVATDQPIAACMLSQYAGWPVKGDQFFAMGSGPMRILRGKEDLLQSLGARDGEQAGNELLAVGTLECDRLPDDDVLESMAEECGVEPKQLRLAVAPTRSLAGCVQVVARSVETALHKLHELGLSLECVTSAYGIAPLAPPTPDFAAGIGRTNDAILYGAHVSLWLDTEDEQIVELGPKLPSCASADFGKPFAEIFQSYDFDFYKVDPGLFSPAEVTILNIRSGRGWTFGGTRADLIAASFGTDA